MLSGLHRKPRRQLHPPRSCPAAGRALAFPSWPSAPDSASERAAGRPLPEDLPPRRRGALPETHRRGGREVVSTLQFRGAGQCESECRARAFPSSHPADAVCFSPCLTPNQFVTRCEAVECREINHGGAPQASLLLSLPALTTTHKTCTTLAQCLDAYFTDEAYEARWAPAACESPFHLGTHHRHPSPPHSLSFAAPGVHSAASVGAPSSELHDSRVSARSWASSSSGSPAAPTNSSITSSSRPGWTWTTTACRSW